MKNFIKYNWFKLSLLIIIVITVSGAVYWFGVRPVEIRKSCTITKWTEPARPAKPASSNWPECKEIKTNPYDCLGGVNCPATANCYGPESASPGKMGEMRASDREYNACLRDNGL